MVIIGASGAVGHAASELAKAKGATVLCLVRKPHDAVRLASTGVLSAILPLESEEMTAELQALIKTHFLQGANVIFDTTGAWLAPSISCLAQHGCVAVIVAPGRGEVNISVRDLYRSGSSIEGVNSLLYSAQDCAQVLDQLRPLFEENKLKPAQNIQIHPLSQGISVYESMSQGSGGQHVLINQSE
jgi:NADPH:quinone reductase-like Zn-dependent oxidoreductase